MQGGADCEVDFIIFLLNIKQNFEAGKTICDFQELGGWEITDFHKRVNGQFAEKITHMETI